MPLDHQLTPARMTEGVTLVDTSGWFCARETCPAVVGSMLVNRDEQHLTTTFARALATELWEAIRPILPRSSDVVRASTG